MKIKYDPRLMVSYAVWDPSDCAPLDDSDLMHTAYLAAPKAKTGPELPAEVWSREVFDADRAWRATVLACKGSA
jgi:hypothetical protein